jgi:hypothetical protein
VINDVPRVPIGGSKTKFREVSSPGKLRSIPDFPHISLWEMSHARPVLHTVFSTTQLKLSISDSDPCHHSFGDASDGRENFLILGGKREGKTPPSYFIDLSSFFFLY